MRDNEGVFDNLVATKQAGGAFPMPGEASTFGALSVTDLGGAFPLMGIRYSSIQVG